MRGPFRSSGRLPAGATTAGDFDWERSVVLTPVVGPAEPALVSDGAGLPFPPAALDAPPGRLDPADPAVAALAAQLARQPPRPDSTRLSLDRWRILARADDEALFAIGRPPSMVTVAMRHEGGRRGGWRSVAITRDASLRVTRDGVRASHWCLEEARRPAPGDTVLHILVTEQTRSGGDGADRRLLAPDLSVDDERLLLRIFVTPRPGVQLSAATPTTPVRIQLPVAVGERELVDGALFAVS